MIRRLLLLALLLTTATLCFAQANFVIPRAMGQGFASNIRPAPTYVNSRALAATVAETATLPADTRMVIFSADCNFYAKPGASIPATGTDITDGTSGELNPAAWYFANAPAATQQITVIAATACNVTMSAYKGVLQ